MLIPQRKTRAPGRRISAPLVLIFWFLATSTQLFAFLTIPPRVRFTGVLLPIKEQSRKGLLDDLDVLIGKERWIFLLDKMEIVGGAGLNRVTLQRLFPPSVRFVGPDDLIHPLESPKIAGKVLIIEGLLYTGSRILFITAVDIGEGQHSQVRVPEETFG